MDNRGISRTAGDTAEHVIVTGRVRLLAVLPELTTTGTITIRDAATSGGSNVIHVCAIGLTQAGKDFQGGIFNSGITVQLSVGTDLCAIVYEKF